MDSIGVTLGRGELSYTASASLRRGPGYPSVRMTFCNRQAVRHRNDFVTWTVHNSYGSVGCPGSISTEHNCIQRTTAPDSTFGNPDAVLTTGENLHPRHAAALWQKANFGQDEFRSPGNAFPGTLFHNGKMPVHRIHLRGPWDVTGPWPDPTESGKIRSITMPQRWQALFGSNIGTATFSRWFHQPTNLAQEDRLAIILTGVAGHGETWLNDQSLGKFSARGEAVRLPMQLGQLQLRNRLRIELSCSADQSPGGLYDAVAIEIDSDND